MVDPPRHIMEGGMRLGEFFEGAEREADLIASYLLSGAAMTRVRGGRVFARYPRGQLPGTIATSRPSMAVRLEDPR